MNPEPPLFPKSANLVEHLAREHGISELEADGLMRLSEVLLQLREDHRFWRGLHAWGVLQAAKLEEADAARTGDEPCALLRGRARECRSLRERLQAVAKSLKASFAAWNTPDPDQAEQSLGEY